MINDYILSPLLYQAPYNTCFTPKKNQVIEEFRSILHDSVVPLRICIAEDVVILFCGSFGYSMIRDILEQKNYEISGKSYLLTKNKSASLGQHEIGVETWSLEMDSVGETDSLKEHIAEWMSENIKKNNKLVIVAGLGKSTSSLLVPLLCTVARHKKMNTSVICTLPLAFESPNVRKLAETSYHIIQSLCTTYVYDISHKKKHNNQGNISFREFQKLLQIGVMKSLKLIMDNKTNCDIEEHRIIMQKREDYDYRQCVYGKYEVLIE